MSFGSNTNYDLDCADFGDAILTNSCSVPAARGSNRQGINCTYYNATGRSESDISNELSEHFDFSPPAKSMQIIQVS